MNGALNQAPLNQDRLDGSHGAAWPWNLIVHPAAFFGGLLQRKPNWLLALAAPALCAILQFVSSFLFSNKTQPIVEEFLAREHLQQVDMHFFGVLASMFAGASWPVTYAMMVAAVVCFDVLFADSGRLLRLAEFVGLSFFAQVPYCLLTVVAAYLWSPDLIGIPLDTSPNEINTAVSEWRNEIFSWWVLAATRVIGYYAMLWQVVLIGVFLKVVSRLKVWTAVLASAFILSITVLIQIVASRW